MDEMMQSFVKEQANLAIDTFKTGKDIAQSIKDSVGAKYPGTWHVIVGRNFGAFVTHETKHYTYFYIGQMAFLVYKSG